MAQWLVELLSKRNAIGSNPPIVVTVQKPSIISRLFGQCTCNYMYLPCTNFAIYQTPKKWNDVVFLAEVVVKLVKTLLRWTLPSLWDDDPGPRATCSSLR